MAMGADTGISKSEVSRICGGLDREVAAFRDRALSHTVFPYVFLDATYCKARINHRIVSQAVVIATGVSADGRREILEFQVGDSEDGSFWTAFLRSLKIRDLSGVQLVISDAQAGLRGAIDAVLLGAAWQRCRVHFVRNVPARVPKGSAEMVAAAIRTIFAQPDSKTVRTQLDSIAAMLGRQFPLIESMLHGAAGEVTAFADFPPQHWKKIRSTNPLERLNREVKRRADVVGVFPKPKALDRLAGAAPAEQHDEWQVGERRYLSEGSMIEIIRDRSTTPPAAPSHTCNYTNQRDVILPSEQRPLGLDPAHGVVVQDHAAHPAIFGEGAGLWRDLLSRQDAADGGDQRVSVEQIKVPR